MSQQEAEIGYKQRVCSKKDLSVLFLSFPFDFEEMRETKNPEMSVLFANNVLIDNEKQKQKQRKKRESVGDNP